MTGPAFFEVVQTVQVVAEPLENPVGTVTFTASPSEATSSTFDETIALEPVEGRWANGVLSTLGGTAGILLVDNQGLGLAAGELKYTVTYAGVPALQSFSFAAPGNGAVVDLSTVTRLPA